jgi:peptidoglycan hydrolase CwlO-like protein
LEKITTLPIRTWNYTNDPASRHIGPVAQDFHAAFNLGTDDKHIATVDADGVALAAIQGLNQKVDELKNDLKHRDAENAELKETVNELKKLVGQMKNKYDTLIQGRL